MNGLEMALVILAGCVGVALILAVKMMIVFLPMVMLSGWSDTKEGKATIAETSDEDPRDD